MRNVNVYTNYSVSQVVYLKEHVLTFFISLQCNAEAFDWFSAGLKNVYFIT